MLRFPGRDREFDNSNIDLDIVCLLAGCLHNILVDIPQNLEPDLPTLPISALGI